MILNPSKATDPFPEVVNPDITVVKLSEIRLQECGLFGKRSDVRLPAFCEQIDCIPETLRGNAHVMKWLNIVRVIKTFAEFFQVA